VRFGLCMIVKDEEDTIADCLDAVRDACVDVVIVDTGSTDRTLQILKQRYGITPLVQPLDPALCHSKAPARNLAFERVAAPWILCLDADEQIVGDGLDRIAALTEDAGPAGYFCAWNTYKNGAMIEDYKLPLFRKGLLSSGRVHENMQSAMRKAKLEAIWLDGVEISHRPDPRKDGFKSTFYKQRLLCAIEHDATWHRYYWFLGHKLYREGDIEAAIGHLKTAADSGSRRFPVECLNSKMLLAEIHAQRGEREQVGRLLTGARGFFDQVADDFEVKVNFRFGPWLERAEALAATGDLRQIKAYPFPY